MRGEASKKISLPIRALSARSRDFRGKWLAIVGGQIIAYDEYMDKVIELAKKQHKETKDIEYYKVPSTDAVAYSMFL